MLLWMVDDGNAATTARMEFAFRFRLAVSGMKAWERIEALVYSTLDAYPVSSALSIHLSYYNLTALPVEHIPGDTSARQPLPYRSY